MTQDEIIAATAVVEQFLMASGQRLNPILVGLDRQAAISMMPDLYDWLQADNPQDPATRYYEPTGRDLFISIPSDGMNAGQVLEQIEEVRQSYFDMNYSPGPVVFFCDHRPFEIKAISSLKDIKNVSLNTHHGIAAILSYFIYHWNDQISILCCHPSHISKGSIQNALGNLVFENLSGPSPANLDTIAPHTSLLLSSESGSSVAVLDFSKFDANGVRLLPPSRVENRNRLSHLLPYALIPSERTPMFSASHCESLSRTSVLSEVRRFLSVQSGLHPRSDRDYLIDMQKAAKQRQWIAADGCERITYSADPSKFGLAVQDLASFISSSCSTIGRAESNGSGEQIAVSLGPEDVARAFRIPCDELPENSSYFCFSTSSLSHEFLVKYINTGAIHNSIVASSAGPWRQPRISRYSIDSLPTPAVTTGDYDIIQSKMDSTMGVSAAILILAQELQRCAEKYDPEFGEDFGDFGELELFFNSGPFDSMCYEAIKIANDLQNALKPVSLGVVYPPYPIAAAQRSLENSSSDFERLMHRLHYSETIVKVLCITFASLRQEDCRLASLHSNANKSRGLKLSFGHWNQWLRALAYDGPAGYPGDLENAIGGIIKLRNDCSHRSPQNEARAGAVMREIEPLIEILDQFASECKASNWIFSTGVVPQRGAAEWRGYSLNGDHPDFSRQTLLLSTDDPRLALPAYEIHFSHAGKWKSLWPWVVLHRNAAGEQRLHWWEGIHPSGKATYSPVGIPGGSIHLDEEGKAVNELLQKSLRAASSKRRIS